MDVKQFELATAEASGLVKALAHPTRLRIVCALSGRDCSLAALAEIAGAHGPATSRHLALLRKDRIVKARRVRRTMVYSLGDASIGQFVAVLAEKFRPAPP